MKEDQVHQDLASIRNLMERSSKFISLSGLSGILAGVYALIGSGVTYSILNKEEINDDSSITGNHIQVITRLAIVAAIVLLASVVTGLLLSKQKSKKTGQQFWGATSRSLLFHMMVPLLTGGLLIVILLVRGNVGIVSPVSLIFYGLALISASSFTFTDIKYLGLCEIALGLIAAVYPGNGLLLWAIGFGVLHIVYGSIMYLKYDR